MMDNDVNIDLTQFHGIFYDECSEGIEVMESELLNLDVGQPDLESINTIFRAAHSIKGSAGTFGFSEIAALTHEMETLLNGMRDGRLQFTLEAKKILLSSVDCLSEMIANSQASKAIDEESVAKIQLLLSNFSNNINVDNENLKTHPSEKESENLEAVTGAVWHIVFQPHENLFFTGNDPFRLIRELKTLGRLEVTADYSKIPELNEIDPENCYLGWDMMLHGDVTLNEINEVFAWVEDACELDINLEVNTQPTSDRRKDNKNELGRRKTDRSTTLKRETSSIRVGTEKVDELLNLVGELVITQSILSQISADMSIEQTEKFSDCLAQLERNTRDLQEQTMSIRMLPIDFAFQRLPRVVHDLSQSLGKNVELKISGESTELDKTVLEKIGDPLLHLVRNALDHGIESPELRAKAGKSKTGNIYVNAHHIGGSIVIEVSDDGAGINIERVREIACEKGIIISNDNLSDKEIQNLIFAPGFSTAKDVTDVSGRGVGMDVVSRNISDLGGTVELTSNYGVGSKFTIRLPLTLAILDGQMVRVNQQIYIVPLHSIIETVQMDSAHMSLVADNDSLYQYREEYIPIIPLHDILNHQPDECNERNLLVIVDIGGKQFGFKIDDVVGQQQVVIKSLENNFKQVHGVAGATVLGDGSVALILDVMALSKSVSDKNHQYKNTLSKDAVTE